MTNKQILLALLLTSALAIPAYAQQATVFGNSGGGAGTVTSVATGNGLCGGTITTTGTLSTCVLPNTQTGTTYATLSTDGGKVVSLANAASIAVSLPQANTAGFTSGFGTDFNNIGAGAVTVTATTSIFDNGLTTLPIATGQDAFVWSDGTNYHSLMTLPTMAADTVLGNFSGTAGQYPIAGALTSCSSGTSALTYNTTTHAFGCNSISGAGTVNTGTAGNAAYYATSTTAVSDGGAVSLGMGGVSLAVGGSAPANGIYLSSANTMAIRAASTSQLTVTSGGTQFFNNVTSGTAGGLGLVTSAVSATVPGFVPNKSAATTGFGAQAAGNISATIVAVEKFRITAEGIQYKQATAPVPTGTGTPTISTGATDEGGTVTAGSSATSIIVTFNLAHTNAPSCVISSQNGVQPSYTLSNTAITMTQVATSGNKIDYRCTFP